MEPSRVRTRRVRRHQLTDGFAESAEAGRRPEHGCAEIRRDDRQCASSAVEPRHRHSAQRHPAHRQCGVPTSRTAGRTHLRASHKRRHDRDHCWSRGKSAAIGYAGMVSVGNVVTFRSANLRPVLGIRSSTAICCSSKRSATADELRAFAQRARRAGKPILAYKEPLPASAQLAS